MDMERSPTQKKKKPKKIEGAPCPRSTHLKVYASKGLSINPLQFPFNEKANTLC